MAATIHAPGRRTLATTPIVFVILVAILIVGGSIVRGFVAGSFAIAARISAAQALSAAALEQQLNEETGLRGFAATNDKLYLEPYDDGRARLGPILAKLALALDELHLSSASASLGDAADINRRWVRSVAAPLLASHGGAAAIEQHGKLLVDRFRSDLAAINVALDSRRASVNADAQAAIDRVGIFTVAAIAAIVLLAMLFLFQQTQLESRLEQERLGLEQERRRSAEMHAAFLAEKRIADTLQEGFAQRPLPALPTVRFSATYVPATEEAKVGGDWYDALELPANRILFAVGDVAGHGIDAAVTMNQARQSLISCALLSFDPASVLTRVNAELFRQNARMVTAVVGYADSQTYEFVYSTAGHPPPVIVEPGRAPRLLDFGSVPLGIIADPRYKTYRIQSVPGAMLVLYTDGAVEHSRDVIKGEELLLEATAQAAASPELESASVIHKAIFAGRPVGDDVAILTICFSHDPTSGLTISADNAQATFVGRLGGVAKPAAVSSRSNSRRPMLPFERKAS